MPTRKASVGSPLQFSTANTERATPLLPPPNPHTAEMNRQRKELKEKAAELVKTAIHPLSAHKEPYVSNSYMENLGISRNTLDFSSGRPGNGQQQYIEPICPAMIDTWLKETQPWSVRRDFDHHEDTDPIYNPQWEAAWLWILIEIWLENAADRSKSGIMLTRTKWKRFSNNSSFVNRLSHPNADWQLKSMLRRVNEPTKNCYSHPGFDSSKPHITGFLADNALLREDMLSTSEVFTVLFLSCKFIANPEYQQHRIVPVTILSAFNRSVRVVQGIMDPLNGTIEVRVSPIVHFEMGVREKHVGFLALLGWLLGKPVGKTM